MTDRRQRLTRDQLLNADMTSLMADAKFRRFIYCILQNSGLRGACDARTDSRSLEWIEGRRSLGAEILNTLRIVDPDAEMALLIEERNTRLEAPSGRRTNDRRDELGGTGRDADGRAEPRFLDYGSE